ncbi:MAG: hypothetical protein AAFY76_24255, partial [Cyanobacteria bacterium J06649_11]
GIQELQVPYMHYVQQLLKDSKHQTKSFNCHPELASGRTDTEIALELNQRGLVSGTGRAFTKASVAWIRWKFGIEKPLADPIVAFIRG